MNEPTAPIQSTTFKHHGIKRIDHYYWLKDRTNPAVRTYLEEENQYTNLKLAPTEEVQDVLFHEMKERLQPDESSVPYLIDQYFYSKRYIPQKEYPVYIRKENISNASEEIILDVNALAEKLTYCDVGSVKVSPDHQYIAYAIDSKGRRIYDLVIKSLDPTDQFEEIVSKVSPNIVWAEDSKHIFYVKQDLDTLRPHQVYLHTMGETVEQDRLKYEEDDDTFRVGIYKSKSKKFILLVSESTLSSEAHYLPSDEVYAEFTVLHTRESNHEYEVDHIHGYFYIRTNWQAQNFRLMRASELALNKTEWEEILAHRSDTLLEEVELFDKYLVIQDRREGLVHIRFRSWKSNKFQAIPFADAAYYAFIDYHPHGYTNRLRFQYQSFHTPPSVYEFDMEKGELLLLKEKQVMGDFNKSNYTIERITVEVRDGIKVPVSLVHRKEVKPSSHTPCILYGYGSYGISMETYFSIARLSMLDRGFIFAVAHIRGGEELGRAWYEDGKLLKKKNTFTDFIDCANGLIKSDYTSSAHLYAMGGSAGGLLMGAVINMEPLLFKGVIASVPFVDVVTTMLDETIPLTTGEYDEWGNPNDKTYFEYMLSYSPYDQVRSGPYPHLLVMAGLHDSQVQYWEPAKWVAKIRHLRTNDNLLLLHTNMEAGHSGPSGRYQPYKEIALEYAFILYIEYYYQQDVNVHTLK